MFLHILGSGSMFTKEFYKMLSKYFPKEEHCFLGYFPDEEEYKKIDGCKIIQSRSLKTLYYLNKADYIIIHGYFNRTVILALSAQPWLLKKCNWVVFGADIYIHKKKNMGRVDHFFEYLKRKTAPKFALVSTFSDGDWELAQNWYGVTRINMKASYPLASCNQDIVRALHKNKEDDTVNIIIGNSATATNQHFQVLDWLEKFKNERIRIHLPLNYGLGDYKGYAQKVTEYAVRIFGEDRIVPLTEKLSGEDYLKYLNNMDVGLFNNDRQQAMGNITQLVLCGAKVYIRTDTNMWEHYRNLGVFLNDIEEITGYNDISQLFEQDEQVKLSNQEAISARQDMDLKVQIWNDIFETMKKKC